MFNEKIKHHVIVNLSEQKGYNNWEVYEIHYHLFNEDYFIVGNYEAEQFLNSCEDGLLGAIELIKNYEQSNFNEILTDFSSAESIANMYAYIKGEELLSKLNAYHDAEYAGGYVTDAQIDKMIEEIKEM